MTAIAFARRMFGGGAPSTTVPGGIGLTDTSDTLASGTNWPSGGSGFFYVVADLGNSNEEKILCASTVGNLLTYAAGGRGADGTAAAVHLANCTIKVCHVAQDDDEANQVVAAVLGQPGAAKGDILAMLSAAGPNTLTRVPIGTTGQLLGVSSGLPAWQYPALTYVESFIVSPVTLTASSITNITSVSLTAGTWLVLGRMYVTTNSASQSIIDMWLGTSSASTTGALAAAGAITGLASSTNGQTIELSKVLVVGTTENVYLNAIAGQTSGAQAVSTTESLGSVTGITAVRIA